MVLSVGVGMTSKIGRGFDSRADEARKCNLGQSLTASHGLEGALTILDDWWPPAFPSSALKASYLGLPTAVSIGVLVYAAIAVVSRVPDIQASRARQLLPDVPRFSGHGLLC